MRKFDRECFDSLECKYQKEMYLRTVDLRGANLTVVNLNMFNLRSVNFTEADLRNASLIGSNLMHCNFTKAKMRGVNLTDAVIVFTKGNSKEIKNIKDKSIPVSFTGEVLAIGHFQYSLDAWREFSLNDLSVSGMPDKEWWVLNLEELPV